MSNLTINPHRRRGLPDEHRVLGRLAGGPAAPRRHHGSDVADGLLHGGSPVRQRWLPRRRPDQGRDQRVAAAVADAEQRDRQLVERRVEPDVLRRRGRAGAVVPHTQPYTTLGDDAGQQGEALPLHRRPRRRGRSSSPRSATPRSARRGPTAPPGGRRCRCPPSSSRVRRTRRRPSRSSWPRAATCSSPPASTASTARCTSAGPAPCVLGLGLATLTAEKGAVPIRVSEVPGVDVAGLTIDAGTKNSSALLVIGSEKGHRNGLERLEPDRGPGRVLPDRWPARRQGHDEPGRQERPRDPGRHLGLARRPR